ncbi:uncharacterized protein TNCV_1808381 [Trichonephila clavipes]|nr:uncharacterized protein TNCV_1808381 [Trichonephila clavipes]
MKILPKAMITNVQILTEDGSLTAVVEPEKRISAVYQNMRSIPNVITEHYGQWVEVLDLSHNKLSQIKIRAASSSSVIPTPLAHADNQGEGHPRVAPLQGVAKQIQRG